MVAPHGASQSEDMNTTQDRPVAPQQSGDSLDRAFAWLRSLGIMRDPSDRWLGGVCSGIAHRLGVDPVIVRIGLIVLAVMGGIGLPAYLVAWSLLPDTSGEIKAESGIRHGDGGGVVLLIATVLSLGGMFTVGDQGWRFGWIVPAAIIFFLIRRRRSHGHAPSGQPTAGAAVPPPPPWAAAPSQDPSAPGSAPQSFWTHVGDGASVGYDASRPQPAPPAPVRAPKPRKGRRTMGVRAGLVTLGLAIAAYGLGRVLDGPTGFPGSADVLGRILALGAIAIAVVVAALRGRTSGFPGFVGVVLAVTTAATIAGPGFNLSLRADVGDLVVQPTNEEGNRLITNDFGDITLDLSSLSTDPVTAPRIQLEGGMGDVIIQIPKDLTVQVDADTGFGEVKDADGESLPATKLYGSGTADVTVTAESAFGNIIIKEIP